jgi:hypothetical protein
MKLRRLISHSLLGLTLVSSPAFAGTPSPVSMPKQVETGGFSAFKFWFAKKLVLDVDKSLQDLGLKADYCTFRQTQPPQDFSYRGAGPCLYKNFSASMKTELLAGTTYVWVLDGQNRYQPIEIQWRPPQGGWRNIIHQYFSMRFEKFHSKKSGATLPYRQFIGGDVKIIFPDNTDILESMVEKGTPWMKSLLANVDSVSLHLDPVGVDHAKVIYSGKIVVEQKPTQDGGSQSTTVALKTDINIIIKKRPFFLEAKVRRGGDIPELPTFPSELLP